MASIFNVVWVMAYNRLYHNRRLLPANDTGQYNHGLQIRSYSNGTTDLFQHQDCALAATELLAFLAASS